MRGTSGRIRFPGAWYYAAVVGALIIGGSLFSAPQVAHADPHAMFYTVVGQQQLFFNVLAALDQADYVESLEQRNNLVTKRDQAQPTPGLDAIVNSTHSDLSTVLTRGVTLEGNDLWTAYQAQQLAREAASRNAVSEFVAVGCERGLGRVGCSRDPNLWQQNEAFVTDPVAWANQPFTEGVMGALLSGTTQDEKVRDDRLNNVDPRQAPTPRAFSPLIAGLRQAVDQEKDPVLKNLKQDFISYILDTAALEFLPNPVRTTALNNIKLADDGSAEPTFTLSSDGKTNGDKLSGADYVDQYLATSNGISNLISAVHDELLNGQNFITAAQNIEEQNGAVADIGLKSPRLQIGDNKSSTFWGPLTPSINTPAYAKQALTQATANTIGLADQNTLFAPPTAANTPGNTKLVGPKDVTSPTGSVLGATSTNNDQQGQVLGLLDNANLSAYQNQYFDASNTLGRGLNTNPVAPNREDVITSALRAFTNDTYRHSDPTANNCGYCLNLTSLLTNYAIKQP